MSPQAKHVPSRLLELDREPASHPLRRGLLPLQRQRLLSLVVQYLLERFLGPLFSRLLADLLRALHLLRLGGLGGGRPRRVGVPEEVVLVEGKQRGKERL